MSDTGKKAIITIAGRPGSGKSTAAKAIAVRLGFKHFSSGDLFRTLGKDHGVDVLNANKTPGVTEKLDEMVDGKLRQLGQDDDRLVIDSRLAWHWIPASFKVFLDLDLQTAARRILGEMSEERKKSEHIHDDPIEYSHLLAHRLEVENKRYKAIYGTDPSNMGNYDLVINTADNDARQVEEQILEAFEDWRK